MATTERMKERLVRFEDEILTALMNVRYALDSFGADRIDTENFVVIRGSAEEFIALAEKIQKQQDKEYEDEREE